MALSIDKLLKQNQNRYEMCTAAIRVSQALAEVSEEGWKSRDDDKIAIVSMEKILSGRIDIHHPDVETYQDKS